MFLMDFDEIHCKNYGINIIIVYELVLYMKAVLCFVSVHAIFFRICCTEKCHMKSNLYLPDGCLKFFLMVYLTIDQNFSEVVAP